MYFVVKITVEGYAWQNSIFEDADPKNYAKVYKIISSFLFQFGLL